MSANTILVYSENPALLAELLGEAHRKAQPKGWSAAAVVFAGGKVAPAELAAEVVYQVEADELNPEAVTAALTAVAMQAKPAVFLLGATKLGMEVAPRLAERLSAGYAAWVVGFEVDPAISAQCMLYTGTGLAAYTFKPGPVILTSAPGIFKPGAPAASQAKVEPVTVPAFESKVKTVESKPKPSGGARLEEARLVVDVGQGVKQQEDLQMVQALAGLLDGQLACSRPIASDRDWFPEWLGLSGAKIKPELCLTVGISGAIQHIVGIRDSRVVAAVNLDENAPIFAQADYGVVADLYEFIPAFMDRLKARSVRPAWMS